MGDEETVYYDDAQTNHRGQKDRAIIKNFDANQDRIQLHGSADDYELQVTKNQKHIRIFYTDNQNKPELIGEVENPTGLVWGLEQFDFV